MLRTLLISGAVLAAVAAPGASGAPTPLMPGVTYRQDVQFTLHGPVVVHVLMLPRPGGLWTLQPALSNETIRGTERLTAMERRLSHAATVAGVSGDSFGADGKPNGILVRAGGVEHRPDSARSSIGIDANGLLHVDRIALRGTVQGTGQGRRFSLVNEPATPNGIAVFTPAWGPATPAAVGSVELVISSLPPLAPNVDFRGVVTQVTGGGRTPIPPGGVVVVARGTAAQKLQAEAPVGQDVRIRLVLPPQWTGMAAAIGGGPLLVRNRKPVFRAGDAFSPDVLALSQPRAAVGQLADGRLLLVAVDGGLPGYSTGLTNYELAQTLARLGAVTAAALGAGPQAGMAFDGKLLTRPSARAGELPIADAMLVSYAGVYAPPPTETVLSPNGDGIGETEQLAYKVVRPSTVTAQLLGPDGVARSSFSGQVAPGIYPLAFPGRLADGSLEAEGTWRWLVTATDDLGRASTVERDFTLDLTLGWPKAMGPPLSVPRASARAVAGFTLTRPAVLTARIESVSGVVLRVLPSTRAEPGSLKVAWDGRIANGATVYGGTYVARVTARTAIGASSLTSRFQVRRLRPGSGPSRR